jgi:hypothetical protein
MRETKTRWTQIVAIAFGGVCVALALSACESTPKWVKTGTYSDKDTKASYGVGEVMGIRNEPLAWDAADNRARAQMSKILSTYTAYLMRDYAASTTAGNFQKTAEEQNVGKRRKLGAATLNGVRPVDRYKDEKKAFTMFWSKWILRM